MSVPTQRESTDFPRLAIVGCGAAAREFYLPLLAGYPQFHDTGILVDRSLRQARKLASEFDVKGYCDNHRSLPAPIDAAIIATPHRSHASLALDFIREGIHVFIEKPLAMDHQQASDIVTAASASGVVAMVNNYRRLFPSYRQVRELIQSGELGKIRQITIRDGTQFAWNSESGFYFRDPQTRGVMLDRGAHTVDVICWWLGGQPRVLSAQNDATDGVEGLMDVELMLSSTRIDLKFSRFYRLPNNYSIEGEKASIEGRLFDFGQLRLVGRRTKTIRAGKARPHYQYAWDLVRNFIDAVQERQTPWFTVNDVAPSIGVIDEAYQLCTRYSMPWFHQDVNIQHLKQDMTRDVTS